MNKAKKVLFDCIKKNMTAIVLFFVTSLLNFAIFYLYNIMKEPFVYAEVLLFAVLLLLIGIDFVNELHMAGQRENAKNSILMGDNFEQCGSTLRDIEYCEMIDVLAGRIQSLQNDFSEKKRAADDYYTSWVHQIKTPIATMKLQLSEDTEEIRALLGELFRIEQYVDMVLSYIRLDGDSNDLVIKDYSLDEIIRETLRKFAQQFIMRKLRLNYIPTEKRAVTDKKWLSFILEQLMSNALKYTPSGEITVSVEDNTIKISDTGIGIAPEDLPRIFEKGYTGLNGRIGQRSSGLGLFLTKKAADLLSLSVSAQSTVGKDTTFSVALPEYFF